MKQAPVLAKDLLSPINAASLRELLGASNLLDLLPLAIYVCDASGMIINYNQKAVALWGRAPRKGDSEERFCGAFKLYTLDGIPIPHNETMVAACLKDGLPREDKEIEIERPDLTRSTIRVNIVPIKDEEDQVVGVINCFYDITKQKKTQKELQWKTRELQDYVDNAAIGLHWVDGNGIIIWANKAELEMLGYTKEEYIGHHISEFHADQDKINDILTRLNCNETLTGYEATLRCKDGSLRNVSISSNVLWNEGQFVHTRCFTIDVTEQKKLFQSLKESEARYKQLLNSLPTGVFTCDKEGKINFYNEIAVQLWGGKPQLNKEARRFSGWEKMMLPDGTQVPADQTAMARALHSGTSTRNAEYLVEKADGSRINIISNVDPLYDEQNNITGAINIFQDTTHLKKAESALRESEARYRNLIQTVKTPLFTTDLEGKITLYNKAAVELWGREPDLEKDRWCGSDKILNADGSTLPFEDCPMAITLKEGRPVSGQEIIVVRPDGSTRYVAPHPQPLYDDSGKMTGGINMLIDITDIKKTEQALKESEISYRQLAASLERKIEENTADLRKKNVDLKKSEERYHKMVEEVEDYAIILLDQNGIIQNWNVGAEKIKGYKENEIVGKSFELFYLKEDQEMGLAKKLLKQAKDTGKALHEGWRRRKDGSKFWGSIVLTALHDDRNQVIGFSKVTRDLTERKLAEEKMKDYMAELEFQNKELEQFAYAASHDMKEPLRKIHFYNAYIFEKAGAQLDSKSREYLSRSLNSVKRMTNLIEDLLTYSRTTSNVESIEEVDLNELAEEIALLHKEEFEQKKGGIIIGPLPVIRTVPFQFKQLLDNLVNNSIKYKHPDREIIIHITSELVNGTEIKEPTAEQHRQYHKISVTDNGIGFETQYADKIFEIFQRLNNHSGAKGSGIGLAICKKIVQNQKGFIEATGNLDEGARFDIFIPAFH
jgi:PAS domain S-box-containing protein